MLFKPGKSLVLPVGAPKLRLLSRKKICELRCSRACQGQRYFAERVRLSGQMAAHSEGNFAALLCRKPAQKGGTPWPGAHRKGPQGREMTPKMPQGRPQKCLPDQCGGWKSVEVLHFFRACGAHLPTPLRSAADARRRRGHIGADLITFPASAVVWMALMNWCCSGHIRACL